MAKYTKDEIEQAAKFLRHGFQVLAHGVMYMNGRNKMEDGKTTQFDSFSIFHLPFYFL